MEVPEGSSLVLDLTGQLGEYFWMSLAFKFGNFE